MANKHKFTAKFSSFKELGKAGFGIVPESLPNKNTNRRKPVQKVAGEPAYLFSVGKRDRYGR